MGRLGALFAVIGLSALFLSTGLQVLDEELHLIQRPMPVAVGLVATVAVSWLVASVAFTIDAIQEARENFRQWSEG